MSPLPSALASLPQGQFPQRHRLGGRGSWVTWSWCFWFIWLCFHQISPFSSSEPPKHSLFAQWPFLLTWLFLFVLVYIPRICSGCWEGRVGSCGRTIPQVIALTPLVTLEFSFKREESNSLGCLVLLGFLNPTGAPRVKNTHPREGQPQLTGCLACSYHSLYPVKDSQESATGRPNNRTGFSPESNPERVLFCLVHKGELSKPRAGRGAPWKEPDTKYLFPPALPKRLQMRKMPRPGQDVPREGGGRSGVRRPCRRRLL